MKKNFSIVPKMLGRDPGMALNAAMSFLAKDKAGLIDYNFYGGKNRSLSLVYMRLTPLCNLRCVMCGQRGEKGVLKGKYAADEAKKVVPVERYFKMVDNLKRYTPMYYLWGG